MTSKSEFSFKDRVTCHHFTTDVHTAKTYMAALVACREPQENAILGS